MTEGSRRTDLRSEPTSDVARRSPAAKEAVRERIDAAFLRLRASRIPGSSWCDMPPRPWARKDDVISTDQSPVFVLDQWAAIRSRCPEYAHVIRLVGVVRPCRHDREGGEILTCPIVTFDPAAFVAEASDRCRYLLGRRGPVPSDLALMFEEVE